MCSYMLQVGPHSPNETLRMLYRVHLSRLSMTYPSPTAWFVVGTVTLVLLKE